MFSKPSDQAKSPDTNFNYSRHLKNEASGSLFGGRRRTRRK